MAATVESGMNHAAVIHERRAPFKLERHEIPRATPGEVIIKNHAIAINPIEWKVQDWGMCTCFFRSQRNEC